MLDERDAGTSCEGHYMSLHDASRRVIEASFAHPKFDEQLKSDAFVSDLSTLCNVLAGRPERDVLVSAGREYQFALLALAQGAYRHAFFGLRLYLELTFAAVHYSAHELELREWLAGRRDNVWSRFNDEHVGILSKNFVRAFCEDAVAETAEYRSLADRLYRECSEFVHGNYNPKATQIPAQIGFDPDAFVAWHARCRAVILVSTFALFTRYFDSLEATAQLTLEPVVTDHLGHLTLVRMRTSTLSRGS